jgi:hypothetical protein
MPEKYLARGGLRVHNDGVDEDSPAGSQPAVITWRVLPAVCAAASVLFLILALAAIPWWGLLAAFFAIGAVVNFRKRYELSQGQLVIRRTFSAHTVILGELTSVEAVPMRGSGGRVYWQLVLEDRQGTRVRLSFLHTALDPRRRFLAALLPFASAPNVRLEGPVDRAMAGTLW